MGKRAWAVLLLGLAAALLALAGSASADLASDLSEAESSVATAEVKVVAARDRLDAVREDYAAAARRADPRAAAARAARTELRELRTELLDRQREARAEIARLEDSRAQEEDDQDEEEATGIGFVLAALVVAAIALAWIRFRASAPIAALAELRLPQAVGLCLGGGLLLLVAGSLMLGGGLTGVIGGLLVCLGIALPVVFLLARHSLQVERGREKALFGRKRLPVWVPRSVAIVLFLFVLAGFVGTLGEDETSTPPVSAQLRERAADPEDGPGAAQLAKAETVAAEAVRAATGPVARREAAEQGVRSAARQLGRVRGQMVKARAEVRRLTRQLAVLVAREEREAEKQAEIEAEEVAEIEEEEAEFVEEEAGGGCDPNYSPCVPAYPPDVDCAEVGGSVSVIGSDPHGLDADGDGIGCE